MRKKLKPGRIRKEGQMKSILLRKICLWGIVVVLLSFLAGCIVVPVGPGPWHGGYGHGDHGYHHGR